MKFNANSKKWELFILTIAVKSIAYIVNKFNKNRYTHLFFYSKEQGNICKDLSCFPYFKTNTTYVYGREYTEMREIGKGYSNWTDAKIIGIGNYGDVKHK